MHLEEIRKFIRADPFRPFRVVISDGSRFDIYHRDFILVSRQAVEVGVEAHDPEDIPARTISCDPLHITRIEPIAEPRRQNGRKRKP